MNTRTSLSIYKLAISYCCLFVLLISHSLQVQANHSEEAPILPPSIYQLKPSDDDDNILNALAYANNWIRESSNSLYLAPHNGASWVKLSFSNPGDTDRVQLIELAGAVASVDLYEWDSLQPSTLIYHSQGSGYEHSFNQREINYRNLIYPLTIPAHSDINYILKLHHAFGQRIEIKSWDRHALQMEKTREAIVFGMIYGSLLLIILYNIFIFISTRERSHLFFAMFGTFSGIFISMLEGHFAQFVAPSSNWPKGTFYAMVSAIMCFSFSFFCISFLDLERRSKMFYRIILTTGSIIAISLIMLGVNEHPIIYSQYPLLMIAALYIPAIAAGFHSRYNGLPSAGYFSLAISLCTLGLCLDFVSGMEFFQWHRLPYSYASMGYFAMILVFALSLADKMRLLNEEKLATTIELVKLTEEKAQSNIEVYKSKLNEVQLEQQADEAKI